MRSLFLIVLGILFILQQTSQVAAMTLEELKEHRSLLATIFMSWGAAKKLDESEILDAREQINASANTDKAVTTLINKTIEHGGSSNDIDEIILGNGLAIPPSAKVDYGAHDIFFGRSSLYGSFKSHVKAIRRRGISSWIVNNGPTLLSYCATAKLIMGFLTPVAAFEETPEGICHLPEGSWHESCYNTTVIPYHSTDPNVPVDSCMLRTRCSTIIPSIPPIENEIYYQSTTGLNLGNNNGTLVIQNPLGHSTSILDIGKAVNCHPLPGSHELSCEIESSPYVSTDPNLQSSTFCQMNSECRNLEGNVHVHNTVYYGHEELGESHVAVENCDGRVLLHPSKRSDGVCSGADASRIREISKREGKISHVLKKPQKDEL